MQPILIIDDSPVIARLLEARLTRAGYQVVQAESGDKALEILNTLQPDLILLDIDMPGISGIDTCRAIRSNARTADIPVLFVTASTDQQDIIAGFDAGGQDYIVKPSTKEELLARVKTHLALYQAQQELKASAAKYRELSFRDDLTGLYNTRYLYRTLQAHLDSHPSQSVSVIFMDIDSFKSVVDTYGHLNGSRTIAELAAVIQPLLPEGCYGVSYGGDEFVVVLVDHDRAAGARVAEQIRSAIATSYFLTLQGLAIRITVSCGVATYPDDAHNLIEILGNADHALFESKRRGKNTVTTFAEMTAPPHQ